jgi:hypothetical protein
MKRLNGFDTATLGYLAAVSAITLVARPPAWGVYLAYHAMGAALVALVVHAEARYGGRFWSICRYWYVLPVILGSFRELHYLIPGVHPFEDFRWDRALAAIDRRWFGDVDAFFLGMAQPQLVDLLHLCYWSYFVILIVPGAVLYAKGELQRVREYSTVLLTALFLSYLGYFLIPAVGPHHFHAPRPPALDGWILGGALHALLMEIEWKMPDAFPSGHALATMTALVMAWRLRRGTFWKILAPGAGVVIATMALRYHYVVDVVASVAILPVAVVLGRAGHAWRERSAPADAP